MKIREKIFLIRSLLFAGMILVGMFFGASESNATTTVYGLTVIKTGGGGTVRSSSSVSSDIQINCGSQCAGSFSEPSCSGSFCGFMHEPVNPVVLSAVPAPGYRVVWPNCSYSESANNGGSYIDPATNNCIVYPYPRWTNPSTITADFEPIWTSADLNNPVGQGLSGTRSVCSAVGGRGCWMSDFRFDFTSAFSNVTLQTGQSVNIKDIDSFSGEWSAGGGGGWDDTPPINLSYSGQNLNKISGTLAASISIPFQSDVARTVTEVGTSFLDINNGVISLKAGIDRSQPHMATVKVRTKIYQAIASQATISVAPYLGADNFYIPIRDLMNLKYNYSGNQSGETNVGADFGVMESSFTVTIPAIVPPTPTLTFTANQASIPNGSSATLTWTPANATSCWAASTNGNNDGGWTTSTDLIDTGDNKIASDGAHAQAITPSATTTYSLECWNSVGVSTGLKSILVTVSCVNTCAQNICSGNTAQICGDSNGDGCTEITGTIDCSGSGANYSCQGQGMCVCAPTNPSCTAANTCVGQTCDDGCSTHNGAKLCQDKNWREVSPN